MSDKATVLTYLYGLERYGIKPGLARMHQLMRVFGNPHRQYPTVHVTGTNGKGSTATLIANALTDAGYRTALYTSPHIYHFNERIRIDDQLIDDGVLLQLIEQVKQASEQHQIRLTFFEFTTALAFLYFAQQKVDMAIVEVGMGGDLDATNIVQPLVAVITNIGLDHTSWLGGDAQEITRHKAGIIKKGCITVTGERDRSIVSLLERLAAERASTLVQASQRITAKPVTSSLENQVVEFTGALDGRFDLALLGAHQLDNAGVAIVVLDGLRQSGWHIPDASIAHALAHTRLPGRLDIVSRRPLIIADGAHNDNGIRALCRYLQHLPRRDVLIFGAKKDKKLARAATSLLPMFEHIVVSEGNYMPQRAAKIAQEFIAINPETVAIPDINQAIAAGRALLSPHGTMVITGSLYLVADALANLRQSAPQPAQR